MSVETSVIEQGAKARVVTDAPNEMDGGCYRKGMEFEVEIYVSAEQSEDGEAFYWGNSDGGFSNVAVGARYVEVVMSAEKMKARRIPTVDVIRKSFASELCGLRGPGFDTDESTYTGSNQVEVYGRTDDGLRFGFMVTVDPVWQCDD